MIKKLSSTRGRRGKKEPVYYGLDVSADSNCIRKNKEERKRGYK